MESYTTGSGQSLTVHSADDCRGAFCPVHNPSLPWPTYWRDDMGFMEYICPCGVGYPAPEDERARGHAFGSCADYDHMKMFDEAVEKVKEAE